MQGSFPLQSDFQVLEKNGVLNSNLREKLLLLKDELRTSVNIHRFSVTGLFQVDTHQVCHSLTSVAIL